MPLSRRFLSLLVACAALLFTAGCETGVYDVVTGRKDAPTLTSGVYGGTDLLVERVRYMIGPETTFDVLPFGDVTAEGPGNDSVLGREMAELMTERLQQLGYNIVIPGRDTVQPVDRSLQSPYNGPGSGPYRRLTVDGVISPNGRYVWVHMRARDALSGMVLTNIQYRMETTPEIWHMMGHDGPLPLFY